MDNGESDYAPMMASGGFLKAAVKQDVGEAEAEAERKGKMRRTILAVKAARGGRSADG